MNCDLMISLSKMISCELLSVICQDSLHLDELPPLDRHCQYSGDDRRTPLDTKLGANFFLNVGSTYFVPAIAQALDMCLQHIKNK